MSGNICTSTTACENCLQEVPAGDIVYDEDHAFCGEECRKAKRAERPDWFKDQYRPPQKARTPQQSVAIDTLLIIAMPPKSAAA